MHNNFKGFRNKADYRNNLTITHKFNYSVLRDKAISTLVCYNLLLFPLGTVFDTCRFSFIFLDFFLSIFAQFLYIATFQHLESDGERGEGAVSIFASNPCWF